MDRPEELSPLSEFSSFIFLQKDPLAVLSLQNRIFRYLIK